MLAELLKPTLQTHLWELTVVLVFGTPSKSNIYIYNKKREVATKMAYPQHRHTLLLFLSFPGPLGKCAADDLKFLQLGRIPPFFIDNERHLATGANRLNRRGFCPSRVLGFLAKWGGPSLLQMATFLVSLANLKKGTTSKKLPSHPFHMEPDVPEGLEAGRPCFPFKGPPKRQVLCVLFGWLCWTNR